MSDVLHIGLLQAALHWREPQANMAMFEEMIWQMEGPCDLIVLPETFTTGFADDFASLAEPMNLTTFKWMRQMAAQTGAALVGSYPVRTDKGVHNRLLCMQPDGQYTYYDKRHLFGAEKERVQAGAALPPRLQVKGWSICPLICYDLRFPVWSRNTAPHYDLLLCIANWPQPRIGVWDILLKARAIENMAFCAGVNICGQSPEGFRYPGHSAIVDPTGRTLAGPSTQVGILQASLQRDTLLDYRRKLPALDDADSFALLP